MDADVAHAQEGIFYMDRSPGSVYPPEVTAVHGDRGGFVRFDPLGVPLDDDIGQDRGGPPALNSSGGVEGRAPAPLVHFPAFQPAVGDGWGRGLEGESRTAHQDGETRNHGIRRFTAVEIESPLRSLHSLNETAFGSVFRPDGDLFPVKIQVRVGDPGVVSVPNHHGIAVQGRVDGFLDGGVVSQERIVAHINDSAAQEIERKKPGGCQATGRQEKDQECLPSILHGFLLDIPRLEDKPHWNPATALVPGYLWGAMDLTIESPSGSTGSRS